MLLYIGYQKETLRWAEKAIKRYKTYQDMDMRLISVRIDLMEYGGNFGK